MNNIKYLKNFHKIANQQLASKVSIPDKSQELVKTILYEFQSSGLNEGRIFVVGGYVRDAIMGKKAKDLDLMVSGIEFEELIAVLETIKNKYSNLGIKKIELVGSHFSVLKLWTEWTEEPIDIAMARTEKSTGEGHKDFAIHTDKSLGPEHDASRRDFTMNSIFLELSLNKDQELEKNIVDFHDGVGSIDRKEVKAVGDPKERFEEDPLRMFRAIRQKNQRKDFVIDAATWQAIKTLMPSLIGTISPERIQEEFLKSMRANPIGTLKDFEESGAFKVWIPEVEPYLSWIEGLITSAKDILQMMCILFMQVAIKSSVKTVDGIMRRCHFPMIAEVTHIIGSIITIKRTKNYAEIEKILASNKGQADNIIFLYILFYNDPSPLNVLSIGDELEPLIKAEDITKYNPNIKGKDIGNILLLIRDKQLKEEISTEEEAKNIIINYNKETT